ncbi:hypothetical protein [Rhizobium sp. CSW-27]|uniref:hypothetical protein n=1 Tax=Rhizobium sp. CSW-27 TaxID=2839985 RepID=UPI001C00BFAB|nr:hypothetical protein [Rhizobium sp. CSW-27]MBT9368743.1 hypothetical protein [Rhizobium sp. CSW-27]
MIRIVTCLAACLALPLAAGSAEIGDSAIGPGYGLITIRGQFMAGDETRFAAAAARHAAATVSLASPGGELEPALAIGRTIHARGFSTSVPPATLCASGCALAWLAGRVRVLSPSSALIVHGSFRYRPDGRREESPTGNARARAYLEALALPDPLIDFATEARRDELRPLTPETLRRLGLAPRLLPAAQTGLPFPPRPTGR